MTLLHFPNAETLKQRLCQQRALATPYYQEKGITKAISELAATNFADQVLSTPGIQLKATLVVNDLHANPSINLKTLNLAPPFWHQLTSQLADALLECAVSAPNPKAKL